MTWMYDNHAHGCKSKNTLNMNSKITIGMNSESETIYNLISKRN